MTESEWLACTDLKRLLDFLGDEANDRKLRLYICSCCRRVWPMLGDDRSRRAVEAGERYADGLATRTELEAAAEAAWTAAEAAETDTSAAETAAWAAVAAAVPRVDRAAVLEAASEAALAVAAVHRSRAGRIERHRVQCELLRDLFHPFRAVRLDPLWLRANNGRVAKTAAAIYEQGRFDALPQLADALQAAGCGDDDLLAHCRSGRHARGCWLLDILLGKEEPAIEARPRPREFGRQLQSSA